MDVKQCRIDLQDGKKARQELRDFGLSCLDEIERLQAQLVGKDPTERLDEAYSQRAEEERQANRDGKQKEPSGYQKCVGRVTITEKIEQADYTENVHPHGFPSKQCSFSHWRVGWRFENGLAGMTAYNIYRHSKYRGQAPGLLPRSDESRRRRDTFMSLEKTCRKLGVSFHNYLSDRIRGIGDIPLLPEPMRASASEPAPG